MKVGKQSFDYKNVYLHNSAVVVGPTENEGPLSELFDFHYDKLDCKQKSWEQAEMQLYRNAFNICLNKNNLEVKDIAIVIGGDLNNQIIIGNYVMRDYDVPTIGLFDACATSVAGMIVSGNMIDAKNIDNAIVAISSHYGTSEKQYRYPVEYGGQKPESSTFTVTAGTSAFFSKEKSKIKLTKATVGRVIDAKINDPLDLGRAMAPAAFYTIKQHFLDFNTSPNDYDLIITGDLSYYGSKMLIDLFTEDNIDIANVHKDAGMLIYDRDRQEVFSGGSGTGCLPAVLYSLIRKQMLDGELKKVLVVATGALLNPIIMSQKETIPGIAHAVVLERM